MGPGPSIIDHPKPQAQPQGLPMQRRLRHRVGHQGPRRPDLAGHPWGV